MLLSLYNWKLKLPLPAPSFLYPHLPKNNHNQQIYTKQPKDLGGAGQNRNEEVKEPASLALCVFVWWICWGRFLTLLGEDKE